MDDYIRLITWSEHDVHNVQFTQYAKNITQCTCMTSSRFQFQDDLHAVIQAMHSTHNYNRMCTGSTNNLHNLLFDFVCILYKACTSCKSRWQYTMCRIYTRFIHCTWCHVHSVHNADRVHTKPTLFIHGFQIFIPKTPFGLLWTHLNPVSRC